MNILKRFGNQLSFPRALILLIAFLLLYETILYIGVGLRQPLWADEGHFIETIQQFDRDISLKQLQTYDEMSTPLPFVTYALWGKIAGFQPHQLRLLSLIIALFTFITFFIFYQMSSKRPDISLLLTLFLIFQPYILGLTVFVYTDMLALFFLALTLIAFHNRKPVLLAISVAGALLCRQYFIFLPASLGIYYLLHLITKRPGNSRQMMIATLVSLIPILLLFMLWQGFSPQNQLRQLYLQQKLHFHPNFLILYICLFAIYLFPLILYRWKSYYLNRNKMLTALFISPLYFLWPVIASEPAQSVGVFTVGFFHKFIRLIVGSSLEQLVFYIAFLLSLPAVLSIIQDTYRKIKDRNFIGDLFIDLSIILFLIIMPFSYLNWEKYFIPVIPLAIIQIINGGIFKFFGYSMLSTEKQSH
jgi:hypothetical protein